MFAILVLVSQTRTENLDSIGGERKNITYSAPYNYKFGASWLSNLYTRMNHFNTSYYSGSGLSLVYRPGMEPKIFPRNRWLNKTHLGSGDQFYTLGNRDSYKHDMANYAELPLRFRT